MVKTAKTIDAAIVVGRATWLQSLTKVLEATITGTVGVTQEPTIGATDEDATVHTVGASIELGTLYDGDETDALRGHVFDTNDPYCAIIDATSDLNAFELYPVSLSELANTVPAADAITDAITMPQSGLGAYGSGDVPSPPSPSRRARSAPSASGPSRPARLATSSSRPTTRRATSC